MNKKFTLIFAEGGLYIFYYLWTQITLKSYTAGDTIYEQYIIKLGVLVGYYIRNKNRGNMFNPLTPVLPNEFQWTDPSPTES